MRGVRCHCTEQIEQLPDLSGFLKFPSQPAWIRVSSVYLDTHTFPRLEFLAFLREQLPFVALAGLLGYVGARLRRRVGRRGANNDPSSV
jgi:hypothetical protein